MSYNYDQDKADIAYKLMRRALEEVTIDSGKLEGLNVSFDYTYKNSMEVHGTAQFSVGNDTYNCEVLIKVDKKEA